VVGTVALHLQMSDLKRFEVGENSASRTMCIAIVACSASLMARSGLGDDPRLGRDIPKLDPKLDPHRYPDASRKTSGLAFLAEHAYLARMAMARFQNTKATRRGAIRTI
jgi:hypothetical protein